MVYYSFSRYQPPGQWLMTGAMKMQVYRTGQGSDPALPFPAGSGGGIAQGGNFTHFNDPVTFFHTGFHGCTSCEEAEGLVSGDPLPFQRSLSLHPRTCQITFPLKSLFTSVKYFTCWYVSYSAPVPQLPLSWTGLSEVPSPVLFATWLRSGLLWAPGHTGGEARPDSGESNVCFIWMCLDMFQGQIRVYFYYPVGRTSLLY